MVLNLGIKDKFYNYKNIKIKKKYGICHFKQGNVR